MGKEMVTVVGLLDSRFFDRDSRYLPRASFDRLTTKLDNALGDRDFCKSGERFESLLRQRRKRAAARWT